MRSSVLSLSCTSGGDPGREKELVEARLVVCIEVGTRNEHCMRGGGMLQMASLLALHALRAVCGATRRVFGTADSGRHKPG